MICLTVAVYLLLVLLGIVSEKKTSYSVDSYRAIKRWGIFFRSQKSVVLEKIDHINMSRGMLNKMFGNGNVKIFTTGSSSAELIIGNVPNYKEFYEILRKSY